MFKPKNLKKEACKNLTHQINSAVTEKVNEQYEEMIKKLTDNGFTEEEAKEHLNEIKKEIQKNAIVEANELFAPTLAEVVEQRKAAEKCATAETAKEPRTVASTPKM